LEKEPKELSEARNHLKQFEKLLKDPKGLQHLKQGIASLVDMAEGDYPQTFKAAAKNLVSSYKHKVLAEVDRVLSDIGSYEAEILWHYHLLMEEFMEAGFEEDPVFKSCHSNLLAGWFDRFWKSLSELDRELLKKQFQKIPATDD